MGFTTGGKSSDERDEKHLRSSVLSINPVRYLLSRNYGELAAEPEVRLTQSYSNRISQRHVCCAWKGTGSLCRLSLPHSLLLNIVAILYSYWRPVALNGEPKLLHYSLI